jgi:hypothetical protein
VAIKFIIGAEETHKIGEVGAGQIRRWLDCTYRFRIEQTIYDLDENDKPYAKLRVPLSPRDDGAPRFERFDLIGSRLDERGRPGNRLFVECKNYTAASNQGTMYNEYLAICYSAFVFEGKLKAAIPDVEFMWATMHPFALTDFAQLTTPEQIQKACAAFPDRLGNEPFDMANARALAPRLWVAIVNSRVDEMIMGPELQEAVAARIVRLNR